MKPLSTFCDTMEKDPKVLAAAAKQFEKFYESEVFADIVNSFAAVTELLEVHPGSFVNFYPELKVIKINQFIILCSDESWVFVVVS